MLHIPGRYERLTVFHHYRYRIDCLTEGLTWHIYLIINFSYISICYTMLPILSVTGVPSKKNHRHRCWHIVCNESPQKGHTQR